LGKRICLTGFSDFNRWFAMQQPDDVEIWCLNESHNCTAKLMTRDDLGREGQIRCWCYNPHACKCKHHKHEFIPRYDRWFQIHAVHHREPERLAKLQKKGDRIHEKDLSAYGRNERHLKFLRECDKPLYMLHPDSKWGPFDSFVQYPIDEVQDALGIPWNGQNQMYVTSSPAYMVALALYEHMQGDKLDEIRIAGIELAIGTEYAVQRPCFEFYLGMAIGMGVTVTRPPQGTALLAAPRYAIDDHILGPDDLDPIALRMPNAAEVLSLLTDVRTAESTDGSTGGSSKGVGADVRVEEGAAIAD
jgi:hypothetical protein